MSVSLRVEAVKNKNSQMIFVLVDQSQYNRMTIINPEGKVLTVPDGLFEPPFSVPAERFAEVFTREQIVTIEKQMKSRSSASRSSGTKRKSSSKKAAPPKFGIGAEWSSSRLTFYKHKIEPLQDTQSFKINVENIGCFVITKADFARIFNDVVISTSYWKEGSFTYQEMPEKAKKFIMVA